MPFFCTDLLRVEGTGKLSYTFSADAAAAVAAV